MSLPTTSRSFRRTADGNSIEMVTEDVPKTLGSGEVLIQIHSVSLNFRDIAMITNRYTVPVLDQGVPCSDAAATVVAVGSSVSGFKKGDYVTPSFQVDRITGQEKRGSKALGGDVDGVLREFAVFPSKNLTKVPDHLSFAEASTIACAGVTAWTALDGLNQHNQVEWALMQGTGGVSIFGVLICLAAGIKPIVTSSSDEKLDQVKALGMKERPVYGINYRTHPNWAAEAQRLTGGAGVDIVVNNVGIAAMEQSYAALCDYGGLISLVGFLGGIPEKNPETVIAAMKKGATIRGIAVGSVKDQQNLCNFLAEKKVDLKPVVDKKTFKFEDSVEAFKYLDSAAHVGKVVIQVAE